jgi:hypothetical protein
MRFAVFFILSMLAIGPVRAEEPSWCEELLDAVGRFHSNELPNIPEAELNQLSRGIGCPAGPALFMLADLHEAKFTKATSRPSELEGIWVSDNLALTAMFRFPMPVEYLVIEALSEDTVLIRQHVSRRLDPNLLGLRRLPPDFETRIKPQDAWANTQPVLAEITARLEENGDLVPVSYRVQGTLLDRDRQKDLLFKLALLAPRIEFPITFAVSEDHLAFGHSGGPVRNMNDLRTFRRRSEAEMRRAHIVAVSGDFLYSDFHCILHALDLWGQEGGTQIDGVDLLALLDKGVEKHPQVYEKMVLMNVLWHPDIEADVEDRLSNRLQVLIEELRSTYTPAEQAMFEKLVNHQTEPLTCARRPW